MSKPSKNVAAFDSAPGGPTEPVSSVTSQPASGRKWARLRTTCEEPPRGKNMSAITTRLRAMGRLKLALEDDRAGDGPSAEQRNAVRVARAVVQPAARDERRRSAAREVDGGLPAHVGHQPGELAERQAGVANRATVGDHGDETIARDAERRARVAAVGDVAVELRGAGGEALRVARIRIARMRPARIRRDADHRLPIRDEQRAGLHQVAPR